MTELETLKRQLALAESELMRADYIDNTDKAWRVKDQARKDIERAKARIAELDASS
jgi:hypothetical protein